MWKFLSPLWKNIDVVWKFRILKGRHVVFIRTIVLCFAMILPTKIRFLFQYYVIEPARIYDYNHQQKLYAVKFITLEFWKRLSLKVLYVGF